MEHEGKRLMLPTAEKKYKNILIPDHNDLLIIFHREYWGLLLCEMKTTQDVYLSKPQLSWLSVS